MHFDPKKNKIFGRLRDITPKERAYYDEQIKNGVMVSTRHPSQEDIDAADKWRSEHSFNENAEELLRGRGYLK